MTDAAITFHPLRPGEDELLARVCRIFEESFPVEERDPVEDLQEMIAAAASGLPDGDRQHFDVGLLQGEIWGAAVYSFCAATRMGFLAYLATDATRRNAGLGARLYQHALQALVQDGADIGRPTLGMALEVERPDLAASQSESALRTRRIGFYKRNGASLLPDLDFWSPPLAPGLPAMRYHVLYHPLAGPLPTTRPEKAAVVQTVLGFAYALEAGDPYLVQALKNL